MEPTQGKLIRWNFYAIIYLICPLVPSTMDIPLSTPNSGFSLALSPSGGSPPCRTVLNRYGWPKLQWKAQTLEGIFENIFAFFQCGAESSQGEWPQWPQWPQWPSFKPFNFGQAYLSGPYWSIHLFSWEYSIFQVPSKSTAFPFLVVFLFTSGRSSRKASFDLLRWITLRSNQADAVLLETNKQRVKDERRHKLGLDSAKLGVSTKLVVKRTTPNLGNPGVCKGWHYYGNYGLGKQSFERQISFSHWKVDVKKGATPIFQRHCGSLQILLSCVFFWISSDIIGSNSLAPGPFRSILPSTPGRQISGVLDRVWRMEHSLQQFMSLLVRWIAH